MAGETIEKIKQKELEAAEIVKEATDEAYKIILNAREKKTEFINEKDKLLEKEEIQIKEKYNKEMQEVLKQIEDEEQREIEKINTLCKENHKKAKQFISSEIVKE
jgi:vacuolar-type H+-ATPase subunit H